ncbi:hypothetical protein [Sinimarinibacterium sp. NLF-5-8]|uniref:hypothetical protein n=1 Tax=Sinimarinibacterium sp. NLF-5-8 TaxID=2698684 RepID=UPI00137C3B30|nr:hypothetical protein [Sinimarinibacterium sp. NLF-5-8]QHS08722.1 hypothetical protein GT972_00235 [Sinimarinibacterium sp. NLF-5-8]
MKAPLSGKPPLRTYTSWIGRARQQAITGCQQARAFIDLHHFDDLDPLNLKPHQNSVH